MTAEREAMTLERQAFVQWLETLQPPIPTTTEVKRAWQGYQAAWQYVREKADFATRMTERIAASLSRTAEPVGLLHIGGNTTAVEMVVTPADLGEWGKLKDDPRVLREGVPVYLHPSEDGREVTNEMVLRAVHASLDWPHPLTHFEARKVLEAVMAEDSSDGD